MEITAAYTSFGLTSAELMNAERMYNAAFAKIPPHKVPVYEGAACVIRAVNDLDIRNEKDRLEEVAAFSNPSTMNRVIYRRAGRADRLLSAIDSFAAAFCGGGTLAAEVKAVKIVQRISDWFGEHGLESARKDIASQLANAKELHNAGVALRSAQSAKK